MWYFKMKIAVIYINLWHFVNGQQQIHQRSDIWWVWCVFDPFPWIFCKAAEREKEKSDLLLWRGDLLVIFFLSHPFFSRSSHRQREWEWKKSVYVYPKVCVTDDTELGYSTGVYCLATLVNKNCIIQTGISASCTRWDRMSRVIWAHILFTDKMYNVQGFDVCPLALYLYIIHTIHICAQCPHSAFTHTERHTWAFLS